MKAKILTIVMLVLAVPATKAQIINELLGQKATQTQYGLQQLAALKVYGKQLKKGYELAKTGLAAIGKTNTGDVNQHRRYFSSLKTVSPAVQKTAKATEIRSIYAGIRRDYQYTLPYLQSSGVFLDTELSYFQRVFSQLFEDCEEIVNHLEQTFSSNQLNMTDDQRLRTICQLQEQMQDK